MSELAGNLPRGALLGDPTVVSEVVRLNPLYQVHGLTSCEPTPALNPRVGMSLTRTTTLPNKLSESEMELTPPESSPLTRGAGRLNTTQRLEMSPPKKVALGPFMVTGVGLLRELILKARTISVSFQTLERTL